MKIFCFGVKNPNSLCFIEGENKTWRYVTPAVQERFQFFKKGDEVDITLGSDNKTVTFMKKSGSSDSAPVSHPSTSSPSTNNYEKKTYGKTPEEQNSIKRQAIGHMVSRTLVGMQGTFDVNTVGSIIDTLYKKYQEVVG